MTTSYNIYSAQQGDKREAVAATARGFESENEKAREVWQIVADLAKNKTSWLRESPDARDYVRGWVGLR